MISFLYFSRYYIIRYGVLINFLGDDFMKKILSVLILILLTIWIRSASLTSCRRQARGHVCKNLRLLHDH